MQAVFLAGGQGTRLQPFTLNAPKPMFPINGRPYIGYLLDQVASFGITEVLLLLGYRAEQIIRWVQENPCPGLSITWQVTPPEYETGARLRAAADRIGEDFILMYCDNYCPIPFQHYLELFRDNHALVQLTAYANRDGYTRNNLRVKDGKVEVYDKSRKTANLNAVDIGYALIAREVLDWLPEDNNLSFEKFAYQRALKEDRLYAAVTEHRYYSIGSYDRMPLTEQFFSGRRAVFLDRDGTINVRPPRACYVETPEAFQWLPGAREAIRRLNDAGWLVLLVSNQPGIARGRLTWQQLTAIEEKMNADLDAVGARIDHAYYCPHNWDKGCFCRKPNPGLLYQAQRDYNLNIPKDCILIGDDDRDIEAAVRANCGAIQITETYSICDAVEALLGGIV